MKHIRLFENEEPDLVERYRELLGLGVIGVLDYYQDLGRAGLDFESYRAMPEPGVRIETNVLNQQTAEDLRDDVESLGVSDFRLRLHGDDLTNRVEAVFPNGDLVSYLWDGPNDELRWAKVNGRSLDQIELDGISRWLSSPFLGPDSSSMRGLPGLTADLILALRPQSD